MKVKQTENKTSTIRHCVCSHVAQVALSACATRSPVTPDVVTSCLLQMDLCVCYRRTSVASDVVTSCLLQTDLCGIRWRKLVWGECGFSPEPMDDPVLSSFSRCLAVDILCVWRRVAAAQPPGSGGGGGLFDSFGLPPAASSQPAAQQHPPLSLHAAKELWIFWYGEEPDLSGLVAPELISSGLTAAILVAKDSSCQKERNHFNLEVINCLCPRLNANNRRSLSVIDRAAAYRSAWPTSASVYKPTVTRDVTARH
uniref:Mediator of RNA polymerase II transcription subunit 13 n=1 Tax=Timema californicum TaxID=61474 RepID=A0A7R9P417_TIMCA|nr:unnamed protein product [Timema californicum]